LKHAGATEALVQVLRDEQVLSITVEDNGRGFAASQEAPGIGLDSIRSRLAFLGGKMDVQSDPDRGASVFVEIILNK
ncbi:MAG: two-component sensor histidine kinase, partial [Bacteroidetes bacterium]